MSDWPAYDKETETVGGWYMYELAQLELLEREMQLPLFTEEWRADEAFMNDHFHRMEEMGGNGYIRGLIIKRMLDCMRRDHVPYDGPIKWHPTGVTE